MMGAVEMQNEDIDTKIECEINGCKVRLFFLADYNDNVGQTVLDQLLLVFDRKMQGFSTVKS